MDKIYFQEFGVKMNHREAGSRHDSVLLQEYLIKNSFVCYDDFSGGKLFLRTKDNSMSINIADLYYDCNGVQPEYLSVKIVTPDKKLLDDILNLTPRMKSRLPYELSLVDKK
jgi:hypothetical protein